jgi:hypothetical protein
MEENGANKTTTFTPADLHDDQVGDDKRVGFRPVTRRIGAHGALNTRLSHCRWVDLNGRWPASAAGPITSQ